MFLTLVRRAAPARYSKFAVLSDSDVSHFERILGKNGVQCDDLDKFNTDWTKAFSGKTTCALLPRTSEEVSAILSHCAKRRISVVPQGGNTGLVGGSVPVHDEVVLSVARINQHFELDADSGDTVNASTLGIFVSDAGIILEDLDNRLKEHGLMMPLDLGAKGSCMIGGNVATSAGGIRLLRYGSLHAHLTGLTAVLADDQGTILKLGSGLRKDNTSFHSPHLFLGSEGQLGVITQVTLSAVPRPTSVQSAWIGVNSFGDCLKILKIAKRELGEVLSSFEFLDKDTMHCVEDNLKFKSVLGTDCHFNLLVETSGSNEVHDEEKMSRFVEAAVEAGAVDGVQASSAHEASAMWRLREMAPVAAVRDGFVFKYDISLPVQNFYKLTEEMRVVCDGLAKRVITYGHLGDGNTHLNIICKGPNFDQQLYNRLHPRLYEWVVEHGGSISAEHGIGLLKQPYVHLGKSKGELELNRKLKAVFDPYGILCPYKMLS